MVRSVLSTVYTLGARASRCAKAARSAKTTSVWQRAMVVGDVRCEAERPPSWLRFLSGGCERLLVLVELQQVVGSGNQPPL
jgi:hypothetical protein